MIDDRSQINLSNVFIIMVFNATFNKFLLFRSCQIYLWRKQEKPIDL